METKIIPTKKIDYIIYYKFACLLVVTNLMTYLITSPGIEVNKDEKSPDNYSRITWPVTSRLSNVKILNQKINLYSSKKKLIVENALFISEENGESADNKLLTMDIANSQIELLIEHTGEEVLALPSSDNTLEDRTHEVNL